MEDQADDPSIVLKLFLGIIFVVAGFFLYAFGSLASGGTPATPLLLVAIVVALGGLVMSVNALRHRSDQEAPAEPPKAP